MEKPNGDHVEVPPVDVYEEYDSMIEKYGKEELQSKFSTVLKESEYYESIFEGKEAVLTVLENSIQIQREDQEYPIITLIQDELYNVIPKMHFTDK